MPVRSLPHSMNMIKTQKIPYIHEVKECGLDCLNSDETRIKIILPQKVKEAEVAELGKCWLV